MKKYYQEKRTLYNDKSIHQDNITSLNEYLVNNTVLKYMKQKMIEFKGELDKTIIIVGYFNIYLSVRT